MKQENHTFAIACFVLVILMGVMLWIGTPARSQEANPNPCGPTASITAMLKSKYGETPGIAGITENNIPLLIFTNPKTGSFTITIRRPGGVSCLMTAGKSWTPVDQPKEGTSL